MANYHKSFFFRFLSTPRSSYNSILIFSEALPVQSRRKRDTLRCLSPISWLFLFSGCVCGGAVITLYSPVWASTPGNPLPQAPKYRPDQDRRNRSPSHPLPFEQAPSPAPFPHRESVPQLESAGLVASASAGRNKGGGGGSRALRHGPAPPPSRGGHVAGSALKPGASGLAAAAEPAPLSLVGPRRGWGEGRPALCLESRQLSPGSHPLHN